MLHSSKTPTGEWNSGNYATPQSTTSAPMFGMALAINAIHLSGYETLPDDLDRAVDAATKALRDLTEAAEFARRNRPPGIHNDCLNFAIQHETGCHHKELIDNLRQALTPPPQFATDFVSNRR